MTRFGAQPQRSASPCSPGSIPARFPQQFALHCRSAAPCVIRRPPSGAPLPPSGIRALAPVAPPKWHLRSPPLTGKSSCSSRSDSARGRVLTRLPHAAGSNSQTISFGGFLLPARRSANDASPRLSGKIGGDAATSPEAQRRVVGLPSLAPHFIAQREISPREPAHALRAVQIGQHAPQ